MTSRMKKIIYIIIEAMDYITIGEIADQISVSTRTVLRSLGDIEKWFENQGVVFETKKGKGIRIQATQETRDDIRKILNREKSYMIYSQKDRSILLRAKLLQVDDVVKLYSLTTLLNVTEATVSSDLEQLEPWFYNYHIKVVKKPGLGIVVEGSEIAKRKAIVALIYEQFHMVELVDLILKSKKNQESRVKLEEKVNKAIINLIDLEYIEFVRDLLISYEKKVGFQFADNGFIALMIRFLVTIKRYPSLGNIEMDDDELALMEQEPTTEFLQKYLFDNNKYLYGMLPKKELAYLAMHIKGTKVRNAEDGSPGKIIENLKVVSLAKEFIAKTEAETGYFLSDNGELLANLVKHLKPALYRLKNDLDIINPLLNDIRSSYPKLYKAVKRSISVIESKEMVEVPEDEIAYLATHIGAVIHRNQNTVERNYNVIVACMFGIGASQFLLAQIKKRFSNINVIKVASVLDLETNEVSYNNIDFIISTVPINVPGVPHVLVDTIVKDEDAKRIETVMASVSPTGDIKSTHSRLNVLEHINHMNEYGKWITHILKGFYYMNHVQVKSMKEIIEITSENLSANSREKDELVYAFERREEKGSTILNKKGMILLHCRVNIQQAIALNIMELEKEIWVRQPSGTIPVKTVVVMVAPVEQEEKVLELLSEINRNIISEKFSEVIQNGDEEVIRDELSQLLYQYYRKQA